MDKTVIGESSICEDVKTVPSSPTNQEEAREGGVTEDAGVISELYSLNRDAKDAYHLLARYRNNAAFNHYCWAWINANSGADVRRRLVNAGNLRVGVEE